MKNLERARQKENGGQILLKIGFLMNLSKRKSKDEDLKKLKLFQKSRNWKKPFENRELGNYFKIEDDEIQRKDTWFEGGHANHV